MVNESTGFTEWLQSHAREESLLGSLARSAANDPSWPKAGDVSTYHSHLLAMGAPSEMQTALSKAWYEYQETRSG